MLRFTLMAALFASTPPSKLPTAHCAPTWSGSPMQRFTSVISGRRQSSRGREAAGRRRGSALHIAHGFLAENGEPLRKLASFKTALGKASHVDIALMKSAMST